jgi:CheY-like chemotaxis protein
MSRMYAGPGKMLLCIDNNQEIMDHQKRIFEQSGYIVVTVGSAREGLRLATLFKFDAVLLEYQMGEMNGHDLAYEIRRFRPDTPVVIVSGGEIPEATRRMVDAVVTKEEAGSELLSTVVRLCERV